MIKCIQYQTGFDFLFQIIYPTGTKVIVDLNRSIKHALNIRVYASPADVGHTRGLCGTFNGNCTDDLTHLRDGTTNTDPHASKCNNEVKKLFGRLYHPDNVVPQFSDTYRFVIFQNIRFVLFSIIKG